MCNQSGVMISLECRFDCSSLTNRWDYLGRRDLRWLYKRAVYLFVDLYIYCDCAARSSVPIRGISGQRVSSSSWQRRRQMVHDAPLFGIDGGGGRRQPRLAQNPTSPLGPHFNMKAAVLLNAQDLYSSTFINRSAVCECLHM